MQASGQNPFLPETVKLTDEIPQRLWYNESYEAQPIRLQTGGSSPNTPASNDNTDTRCIVEHMARHQHSLESTKAIIDAFLLGTQCSQTMDKALLREFTRSLGQTKYLCGKVEQAMKK